MPMVATAKWRPRKMVPHEHTQKQYRNPNEQDKNHAKIVAPSWTRHAEGHDAVATRVEVVCV